MLVYSDFIQEKTLCFSLQVSVLFFFCSLQLEAHVLDDYFLGVKFGHDKITVHEQKHTCFQKTKHLTFEKLLFLVVWLF